MNRESTQYYPLTENLTFCCSQMQYAVVEIQSINYNDVFDEYAIRVVEDNISFYQISHCPWCGKKLPESQRAQWFAELESLGFDDPFFQDNIPENYKSARWRKSI